MKDQEIDFWTKERDHCIKFMRPKHEMWRRLLNAYRLEFEGIKKKNLKKKNNQNQKKNKAIPCQ